MGASFLAEVLKLRKRPAAWVLALVWVVLVVLFGYLFTYSFAAAPVPEDVSAEQRASQEALSAELLRRLFPENLLENLFGGGIFSLGAAIVLILGALSAGSEYGWGTLKTALSQRPGRLGVLSGKVLALFLALVVFALLGLAAGALGSFVVATLQDAAVEWPPLGEILRGLGAGVLIFCVWGFLGFVLATLFRGTALAIGLGLAWAIAIENLIASLPIRSEAYETFRRFTLGENTLALGSVFGSPGASLGVPEPLVEPERAVITLCAYALVFILASAFFFRRRDVT